MNVDIPRLNAALEWIEHHPEQHDQDNWRCDTTMCLAGVVCMLDPDTDWYSSPSDYRTVPLTDNRGIALAYGVVAVGPERRLVTIPQRAREILGDDPRIGDMFHDYDTLYDLKRVAAELASAYAPRRKRPT